MRRAAGWLMVVALVAALVTSGDAQDQRGLMVPERVRQAQAIVAAANVELREEPVTWQVEATEAGLTLAARRAVSPLLQRDQSPPLLTADVTLDARGELLALQVRGTLLEAVRQKVADGARATADVLIAARAMYPPSDSAAADAVVPDGVVAALGGRRTGDVQFREQAPEAPAEARTWRVALDGPGVSTSGYTLVVEPVEGRLLSVVRR